MDLIISHNACPDGWAAAYIAKRKYPEAEILLLNHGIDPEPVLDQSTGKDVIMLDYSLRTRELNDRLNARTKSFRILDHHKTAQAALDGAPYATFDMTRSGAGLAWDYLFGKDSEEHKTRLKGLMRPWWVDYTEDQDLWNWFLPASKEINAYLSVQPRTIDAWDRLDINVGRSDAQIGGVGVRLYIEYYTRSVVAEAQEGVLPFGPHRYKAAVLNIPYVGVSEAGNDLVRDGRYDVAVLWFERGDGMIQFSLRSNKLGSNVDVSAIAKAHGGGGHHNAAGFQVSVGKGRQLVDDLFNRKPLVTNTEITRSPGGCA